MATRNFVRDGRGAGLGEGSEKYLGAWRDGGGVVHRIQYIQHFCLQSGFDRPSLLLAQATHTS